MNVRERFNAMMEFQPADRCVFATFSNVWPATRERWKREGLGDRHWAEMFDFDVPSDQASHFAKASINFYIHPPFEEETLEKREGRHLVRDGYGVTRWVGVDGVTGSHFVDYPVKDHASWEPIRERLNPETPGRLPDDLDERAAEYAQRDYVLGIGGKPVGFFSCLRELMGAEEVMIAAALKPDWIREMSEHLADFWISVFGRFVDKVQPDFLYLWELICTNKGPIISPAMFRDLFLPSYKRFLGAMKEKGVRNIIVDCQGNFWQMLPPFLEAGVTGFYPIEVNAGMDVAELREKHPRLQMFGGIRRYALVEGPESIDREMERVAPLVEQGGYLPSIDHAFSSDIPWDNFVYYVDRLREITSTPIRPRLAVEGS